MSDQMTTLQELKAAINNDVVKAVEAIFRVRDTTGKLHDYKMVEPHQKLIRTGLLGDNTKRSRIINKGRQGGFTTFVAVEDLVIAQLMPYTWQYYIATKEDQAKKWLERVERLAKDSRVWFDGSRIIDIDETHSSQLEKVIKHFPKEMGKEMENSYICGLAASPGGIRGESAINITIDEIAHMIQRVNQQREVFDAITSFIASGGQMTAQSTPLVTTDLFWDMYTSAEQKLLSPFYFPNIENWRDLDLHRDLREQTLVIPYPWLDVFELEKKRRDDLDHFKQECLGIPADVIYRFIPPELLSPRIISVKKFKDDMCGYFKISIDPAQMRDISAVTVGEMIEDVWWERWVGELTGSYPEQKRQLEEYCLRYRPIEMIIDNTGPGIGLADIIEDDSLMPSLRRINFQSYVELKSKKMRITEYMALEFKKMLINEKYNLIPHSLAENHCLRIEKIATEAGATRYTGKRGGKRDDYFWSKAMLAVSLENIHGKIHGTFVPAFAEKGRTEMFPQFSETGRDSGSGHVIIG
jgi:hypothetical protein